MIPITTGSGFVTAIDSDPCPGPAFDLPQQPPWLPFLRRLRHRAIQLPTFGDLPRRQVQPQFDDFGLGFCLALSSLLFLLIHRADNVAAGAAAGRLMSSSEDAMYPHQPRQFLRTVNDLTWRTQRAPAVSRPGQRCGTVPRPVAVGRS